LQRVLLIPQSLSHSRNKAKEKSIVGRKIVEMNVSANVFEHFVCCWKAARWAKTERETFDVGWRACQLKRMERSFYPVEEISLELQFLPRQSQKKRQKLTIMLRTSQDDIKTESQRELTRKSI
jgi:hypothetical protein